MASFVKAFETPEKIVIQILVTLIRSHQSESRILTKQALDILAPALPARLIETDESASPTWVKWTRKILVEDGHVLAQLISIWQLIIRHPDLYYSSRELLVQYIVGSLAKLGLTASSTADTRILTIDLVDLVYKWEKRRLFETQEPIDGDGMDVDQVSPTKREAGASARKKSTLSFGASYSPNQTFREMIMNYLLRFLCSINEPLQKRGLTKRIVDLIRGFYAPEMWPDVNVRAGVLERYFNVVELRDTSLLPKPKDVSVKPKENAVGIALSILTVVNVISSKMTPEWFMTNLQALHVCIEKCLGSDNVSVIEAIMPILKTVLAAIVQEPNYVERAAAFTQMLQGLVNDGLLSVRNIFASVLLLKVLEPLMPELIPQNLSNLSKLFLRLCKDHPPLSVANNTLSNTIVSILCECIDILNHGLVQLADGRKVFTSGLWQLLDKSNDTRIHQSILSLMKEWVMGVQKGSPLTWKEKSALALRFAALESRCSAELFEEFLRFIIQIYKDESLAKTELYILNRNLHSHLELFAWSRCSCWVLGTKM